jgi:hypothetical protein
VDNTSNSVRFCSALLISYHENEDPTKDSLACNETILPGATAGNACSDDGLQNGGLMEPLLIKTMSWKASSIPVARHLVLYRKLRVHTY